MVGCKLQSGEIGNRSELNYWPFEIMFCDSRNAFVACEHGVKCVRSGTRAISHFKNAMGL